MEANTEAVALLPVREEERLESALKLAITDEDFERAAELRDKLRELREQMATEEKVEAE